MKNFSTSSGDYLAVEIPAEADEIEIFNCELIYELPWGKTQKQSRYVDLPLNYTYTIIGIAGKLSEGEQAEIIDTYKDKGYAYYENGGILEKHWCETAYYSYHSLLRAHNISPNELIIKREK